MHFRDLRTGDRFQFSVTQSTTYEYRGNGWYGLPYSGGPWHRYDSPPVVLVSRPITHILEGSRYAENQAECPSRAS